MSSERKIAIYSRKSKLTGKGESIENQIALCKERIKNGSTSIKDSDILIYEDEGFSGKNTSRPKFQKLLKDIEAHKISTLVCYKLDRVSRSIVDFSQLKEKLDSLDVEFISVKEDFDTRTPMGKAMMGVVMVFAQLERETTAERVRDNLIELAKSGRWLGGNRPTGYRSVSIDKGLGENGRMYKTYRLEIVPDEAHTIKTIFNKFLEFNSLAKVETYLLQNNIQSPQKRNYSRTSIKSILRNPIYAIADSAVRNYFSKENVEVHTSTRSFNGEYGIIAYNKTCDRDGNYPKVRDITKWIVAIGTHEGLISGADWVRTQELLEQNRSKSYRKPRNHLALLSGLLYYKCRDSYMRPKLTYRYTAAGEHTYCYLCETKNRSRGHVCQMKNPNGNELDAMVCNEIKKLGNEYSVIFDKLSLEQKRLFTFQSDLEVELETKQRQQVKMLKEVDTLLDSLASASGTSVYATIIERIEDLQTAKAELDKQVEELERSAQTQDYSQQELESMKQKLVSFSQCFDMMTVEEKRTALRKFISKVTWDGETVEIYFFGHNEQSEAIQLTNLIDTQVNGTAVNAAVPFLHSGHNQAYDKLPQSFYGIINSEKTPLGAGRPTVVYFHR